ncbi:hypothetical protein AB4K20DRAFT_1925439 [Rhizopus microsporus]
MFLVHVVVLKPYVIQSRGKKLQTLSELTASLLMLFLSKVPKQMITSMSITQSKTLISHCWVMLSQVIAASYGEGESYHQVRRCSTREYYTYTGSKRHEKRERMSNEDMIDVLLNTLTTKTAGISRYLLL